MPSLFGAGRRNRAVRSLEICGQSLPLVLLEVLIDRPPIFLTKNAQYFSTGLNINLN